MSTVSSRGSDFERKIASILRNKLGAKVFRDKRSGAGTNRSDIIDYYNQIPLHLELKDQETIKVKEWFRQASEASSFAQAPTLVFQADEEILACLRFNDLVNFLVEIADQKAEIEDLRTPIVGPEPPQLNALPNLKPGILRSVHNDISKAPINLNKVVNKKRSEGAKLCRAGHIADEWGYCQQLGCKFSRGYRPPKAKK